MTTLDYAVIGLVLISALLGVWRGLVYEVLSLLGWLAAYWVARTFGRELIPYLPQGWADNASLAAVLAFGLAFLLTLLLCGGLTWLLSKLVKLAGLGLPDRLFGGLFGLLRGGMMVLLLVWLAGLTALPKTELWREAQLTQPLQQLALAVQNWLPDGFGQNLHY